MTLKGWRVVKPQHNQKPSEETLDPCLSNKLSEDFDSD